MYNIENNVIAKRQPWNKGKLIGQRPPLKLREVWAIRIRLQLSKDKKELALFNTAIDSKLRSCDLIKLRVSDVSQWGPFSLEQWLCNKRRSYRFNSRFQSQQEIRYRVIWRVQILGRTTTCSKVGSPLRLIYRQGNTLA